MRDVQTPLCKPTKRETALVHLSVQFAFYMKRHNSQEKNACERIKTQVLDFESRRRKIELVHLSARLLFI